MKTERSLKLIKLDGSIVESAKGSTFIAALEEAGEQDLVILGLKMHQIKSILSTLHHVVGPKTVLLGTQNGIPWWYFQEYNGPEEFKDRAVESVDPGGELKSSIDAKKLIATVVYPAAIVASPGVIKHIEGIRFPVGEPNGKTTERVQWVSNMLIDAGFKSPVLADVRGEMWLKLWGTVAVNPLSALTHATLDVLCTVPAGREVVVRVMKEVEKVANRLGSKMRLPIERRVNGAAKVGKHKTSMLQDVEAGRELEIETIMGAIVEMARVERNRWTQRLYLGFQIQVFDKLTILRYKTLPNVMAFVAPFVSVATPSQTNFVSAKAPANFIRSNPRFRRTLTTVSSSASTASDSIKSLSSRVRFPSLRPDEFRHPVDVRATRALQSLFGLEWILRSVLKTAEQMLFFENISTGVRVSERQYPSMHAMLLEACQVLDVPVPQLYVRQNPVPNAYTLAVQGNKPFIVVHSALIELVTPQELQAVLAHELGHLKSEHGVWVTMANLLLLLSSTTLGNTLGSIVYEVLNRQLLAWQRAAELTCDRAMLLVMQDKNIAMSALMKLTGGVSKYSDEMDLDEFLAQADQFDEASKTRLGSFLRQSMTVSSTHPLPILRARELKRWSESNHFRSLIRSGKPMRESS
ncbi:unnamed protein product [Agarophyton chilense]